MTRTLHERNGDTRESRGLSEEKMKMGEAGRKRNELKEGRGARVSYRYNMRRFLGRRVCALVNRTSGFNWMDTISRCLIN